MMGSRMVARRAEKKAARRDSMTVERKVVHSGASWVAQWAV